MDRKPYDVLISVDMSMRSTGLIAATPDNEVVACKVIKTSMVDPKVPNDYPKFADDEPLIYHIAGQVHKFMEACGCARFVIETLAFAGKSAKRDTLAGIYWAIRVMVHRTNPNIPIGTVPVASWRCKVLTRPEQQEAKKTLTPKADALKIACVNKLPDDARKIFLDYIDAMGYDKKSIYDLTDAYFLAKYRNSLDK